MTSGTILEDRRSVSAYLSFGYLPVAEPARPLSVLQDWSGDRTRRQADATLDQAVAGGVRTLKAMAERGASAHPRSKHVLLLSGGFDSRAILGSLLEVTDRSNIVACTYGTPGNEEFDVAAQVARVAGIEHVPVDIRDTRWSTEELVDSVRFRPFPPSFVVGARLQNYRIYKRFGHDCLFWDGFLGDALTGHHLKSDSAATDWPRALAAFVRSNSRGRKLLAPPDFDPLTVLPSEPFCPAEVMAFDDQLDLGVRQSCYIGNRQPSDYETAAPFAEQQSWAFWLGLPRSLRRDQLIYKAALPKAFPKLFSVPAAGGRGALTNPAPLRRLSALRRKASLGLLRVTGRRSRFADPHHRIGEQMRTNDSLRSVVSENIADLERRRLIDWVSPERIWTDHLSGVDDHTDAVRILVSLEIALKVRP